MAKINTLFILICTEISKDVGSNPTEMNIRRLYYSIPVKVGLHMPFLVQLLSHFSVQFLPRSSPR